MFSKEESARLRKEFWTSFGKSFPRKWLLYHTKIKGVAFKFQADRKNASVCLDFENPDEIVNALLFEQLLSLRSILESEYLPEVLLDDNFELENRKIIHRVYVPFPHKFSIHNKNTWRECFAFFVDTMSQFELFYHEYEDYLKQPIS